MNILFIVVSILGCAFVVVPVLLRVPFIANVLTWLLRPLKDSGYKSSYIETFGAILGTFLAVTGALWTQRKIDERTDEKELIECALIIYYDFTFALDDLITLMQLYTDTQQTISNVLLDYDEFIKRQGKCRIYIDKDWIHNVAKLSHALPSSYIQNIYKLYGDLSTIKNVFNSSAEVISEDDAKMVYSMIFQGMCNFEAVLRYPLQAKVSLKEDIVLMLEKIKEIAQIDE